MKLKIISGGQTGADLAGLWAATIFRLPTGGMAPKGWRTQLGPMPQLNELFSLTESESGYHGRTLENCENSDLTLIFASNIKSPGTKLTLHHCCTNGIRYRVFSFSEGSMKSYIDNHVDAIYTMLNHQALTHDELTINIAGNSTSTSAPTFPFTFTILWKVFERMYGKPSLPSLLSGVEMSRIEVMLRDCYDVNVYDSIQNVQRSNN